MKLPSGKTIGRFAALILVTLFAGAVMLASSTRWVPFLSDSARDKVIKRKTVSWSPVVVQRLQREMFEITDTYSGMVRPFERYTYAFDIAGRIDALGTTQDSPQSDPRELDVGDRVAAGTMLATLDRRALAARLAEANARKEQTQVEFDRIKRLKQRNPGAVTDTELQQRQTDMLISKAQAEAAQKDLDDATLTASAAGVISERSFKVGESVNPRQAVFEVIQIDRVLLTVGVPQSRVGALIARQRELQRQASLGINDPAGDDFKFRVYVEPARRNSFAPQEKPLLGEVYRIAPRSNDASGLFDVEILLDNRDGLLRPGMIAVGRIVVDRREAYRIASSSALFRDRKAYLFSVLSQANDAELLFWDLGSRPDFLARRWELNRQNYVEQGRDLIVFDVPEQYREVVVRGQHRLVDGNLVRIVPDYRQDQSPASSLSEPAVQTAENP